MDRQELIVKLKTLQADPTVQFQRQRRHCVARELAQMHQEVQARAIPIPVTPDAWNRRVADLPPTVDIGEGCLEVRFDKTDDLLQQLFELAQAITNDYEKFQHLCEPQRRAAATPFTT